MREMILGFEKSDQRLMREGTAFGRDVAEDRRVHDQVVLSILDRIERLDAGGSTGPSG